MVKRWKYRKVTPEILEKMREKRAKGMSYSKLGKTYDIDPHTVRYWLDDSYRQKCVERAKKRNKQVLSPEQKARRKEYIRNYIRNRYNEDQEFRRRFLGHSRKWQKKKKEEVKESG